jgi:long-chain acyl-CoA synthetase
MARTDAEISAAVEGHTVLTYFAKLLQDNAGRTALRWLDGDEWKSMTFGELEETARRIGATLAANGVGRGDRVVLMMRNIAEFHAIDLGVLMVGATPVSIYNSSSPDQVAYLASHCDAKVAIVEDESFLARFEPVLDELPSLTARFMVRSTAGGPPEGVGSWDDLVAAEPLDPETAFDAASPGDLATIIYTSGTTGSPKGVMLDHENLCWTLESLREAFETDSFIGQKVVSYLPMAHIAERVTSHYGCVMNGYEVSCCPEPSMIATYLAGVRPNIIFGVPRVWEKLYAGVNAALSADPEKKQKVDEAVEAAAPLAERMALGTATQEDIDTWNFLDAVAFSTIRQLVGLDELDLAVTGAAPMTAELLTWFRAIGVPLAEIYGMSESSGPISFAARRVRAGTVGPAIPGLELALAEDGEVICRGGNIFRGYLNEPVKSAEALDEDGWLHTGDIGVIDDEGYLRIVDRKKELIITAGGKNISPANLEASLKNIPLVGQACAIGDNRPFVSALLVLDAEAAPVWAAANGLGGKSLAELAQEPAVIAEIERGLAEVMSTFNNAERVKKFTLFGEEWMPDSELLTPTSKLKRRGIHATFAREIEAMYA